MTESILLVLSIVIDCLLASFAYGSSKIKIPLRCALVIAAVGTLTLSISLLASQVISRWIPPELCRWLSFSILLCIGVSSLFQNGIKDFLRRKTKPQGELNFHIRDLRFVLRVYLDETTADRDHSKTLSLSESLYLALALSVDSLAIGLGSGFFRVNWLEILPVCFLGHLAAVCIGFFAGERFTKLLRLNLSWLSGAILIVLAFLRAFA